MNIQDFLSPANTIVDVRAADKARLLDDLAKRAAASLHLEPLVIAQEVSRREELGSTGMGAGIAIPHARLPELETPFGLLARLKRPIDFDAIDGQPVDVVFLLLQPAATQSDLNALASVARKLREPDRLARMRQAEDGAALFREMTH
jgi:PTS system nitrogen regulatory IIA component